MCKLDILQAYDFRPDLDRSCPASTGGESTTTPAVTVAPTEREEDDDEEGEEEEEEIVVTVNLDEEHTEVVATASVSTSVNLKCFVNSHAFIWEKTLNTRFLPAAALSPSFVLRRFLLPLSHLISFAASYYFTILVGLSVKFVFLCSTTTRSSR